MCLTSVALLVTACSSSTTNSTSSGGSSSATAAGGASSSVKLSIPTTSFTYGSTTGDDVPVDAKATALPAGGNGGNTDVGVTATSITITQLISLSGVAAGLFQAWSDDAKAYASYINSLGGIYGRKLNIIIGDDAFDATKDQAVCANDVPKSFAIVGGAATGDTGCYPLIKSSGIPDVAPIVYDPRLYSLPNVFTPKPDYYGNLNLAMWMAVHPGVKKVWICNNNVPGVAAHIAPEKAAWESLGVKVLNLPLLDPTATDLTAPVLQAKNAGAEAADCFSQPAQSLSKIASAMQQQGWNPSMRFSYAASDPNFVKLAGNKNAAGWGTSIAIPYFDSAVFGSTPGGKLFEKWTGGPPENSAAYLGWEYMDLFVQGLIKAGPDLTRTKFNAALSTVKNFTADGMVPPFDAGTKGALSTCVAVGAVNNDGKFAQIYPAKIGTLLCGGKYFS